MAQTKSEKPIGVKRVIRFKFFGIIFSLGQSLTNSTCQTQGMKNENTNPQSPCCNSITRKCGKFRSVNGDLQRYSCLKCRKTFSEKQPIIGMRIATEEVANVVQMLCEGVGVRAASRLSQLSVPTILRILDVAGKKAEALLAARVTKIKVEHLEIDEVYGFVGCLQQNTDGPDDEERGDQYAYLGIDAETKVIVNVHAGKRDHSESHEFLTRLKGSIEGRFQLTSDGFNGYRSRELGVQSVFGNDVDYATETKRYGKKHPGIPWRQDHVQCLAVTRKSRIGSPDMARATVNHAERCNLSFRMFNRRFARKTIGFSRKWENHRWSILLQAAHFNFCRVHSSLKKTPAMAAGLTDHVWTEKELLLMGHAHLICCL